ncbi:MAG TPA: hypothetical protein DC047_19055 [Blastocatellia bacterium]|nr:hypothetical protein [Blastocatellia bacterium]
MQRKDFIDLADDPTLISGIHNYCDRWCERCAFSARCLLYATEKADEDDDPASRDINNEAFWHRLASIYAETKEMISARAKENGVDLSPSVLAEAEEQIDRKRAQTRNHPLAKAAEEYAFAVNRWFEKEFKQVEVFSDTAELNEVVELDEDVNDYLEVIRWYQFLIAVKLMRGISSRFEEDEYGDEEWRDSDGSAKVALIGIDRSISAWKLMSELRSDNADSIRKFLLDLEKLRFYAEREFPTARDFIRPGFDEASLDILQ